MPKERAQRIYQSVAFIFMFLTSDKPNVGRALSWRTVTWILDAVPRVLPVYALVALNEVVFVYFTDLPPWTSRRSSTSSLPKIVLLPGDLFDTGPAQRNNGPSGRGTGTLRSTEANYVLFSFSDHYWPRYISTKRSWSHGTISRTNCIRSESGEGYAAAGRATEATVHINRCGTLVCRRTRTCRSARTRAVRPGIRNHRINVVWSAANCLRKPVTSTWRAGECIVRTPSRSPDEDLWRERAGRTGRCKRNPFVRCLGV